MKEYKVGDTIYVKDTVTDIDYGDSTATYYGKHYGWFDNSCIIDELPTEPVKTVLPKKVADELEIAKKYKDSFDVYIMRIINSNPTYENSHVFWRNSGDGVIKTLMAAWKNGYTVEPEKKYNVKVPHAVISYFKKTDANYCIAEDTFYVDLDEDLAQFTEAEIEKYGLQDCEKEEVTDDEQ